jgi:Phytanoyl-CoA dioxygenase (PhyH)
LIWYAGAVHIESQQIRSVNEVPAKSVRQLIDSGFVVIRGPHSDQRLAELAVAYDRMMARASGPDFKIASTTIRLSNVLNYGPAFDDIFLHPPLHEACAHVIDEPFKLSSLLARTLRPNALAQDLHADMTRSSEDVPLVGFIFMVDAFREDNGATRFVPSSHGWPDLPTDRLTDTKSALAGEVLACGEPGSMIIFNGAIWHGHTANVTSKPRRSIQGYFVRRNARSVTDFTRCLLPETQARMNPSARYLLSLD